MGRDSRSRSRGRGGGADEGEIQRLVDDRQAARDSRDFGEADKLRDELQGMGVRINDTDFTWDGPDGMRGSVTGKQGKGGGKGKERRDGDWDCPECGKLVFASKESCGISQRHPSLNDRFSFGMMHSISISFRSWSFVSFWFMSFMHRQFS